MENNLNEKSNVIGSSTKTLTPTFSEKIIINNGGKDAIAAKGNPNFSLISKTNEGIYAMADDYGTSYYFRGAVDNNWVKFGNLYWRIVRVNGDNSVKLIYSGPIAPNESQKVTMVGNTTQIGEAEFNEECGVAEYVGYMYTLEDFNGLENSSAIKNYLENWYVNNLASQDNKIADTIYCNDRTWLDDNDHLLIDNPSIECNYCGTGVGELPTMFGATKRLSSEYFKIDPNLTCKRKVDSFTKSDSTKGNGKLLQKIGLLTADEAALAGLLREDNSNNYLYTNKNYWLISPSSSDWQASFVYMVDSKGGLYGDFTCYSNGVRPVISVSSDIHVTGSGAWNDPYLINF